MLNSKLKRSALSLILAVMLVFSVFSVNVFAEETSAADTDVVTVDTDATTETAADDGHDHDHEEETKNESEEESEEKKGLSTFDIVSLAILGVLIIVGVVYCLKNKEKVGKFLRSLKSEIKNISWSSWRDVRKNTLVVIVVVVAVAIAIGVIDYLFSMGIISLDKLIG